MLSYKLLCVCLCVRFACAGGDDGDEEDGRRKQRKGRRTRDDEVVSPVGQGKQGRSRDRRLVTSESARGLMMPSPSNSQLDYRGMMQSLSAPVPTDDPHTPVRMVIDHHDNIRVMTDEEVGLAEYASPGIDGPAWAAEQQQLVSGKDDSGRPAEVAVRRVQPNVGRWQHEVEGTGGRESSISELMDTEATRPDHQYVQVRQDERRP